MTTGQAVAPLVVQTIRPWMDGVIGVVRGDVVGRDLVHEVLDHHAAGEVRIAVAARSR